MLKCKCSSCKQLFILPADYAAETIKCPECGAMNRPNPIEETHQEFSLFRLPTDKLIGYVQCRILGKQKWVIPVVVVFVLGISGWGYSLCRESPVAVELRTLNTQASRMIFKNQPEEAMKIYDQIQERLRQQNPSKMTREWTQRINEAQTMGAAACERNFIRKCQPRVIEAEVLAKKGHTPEARKILKQVLEELDQSPWKGKSTQRLRVKVQHIQQTVEEKNFR